MERKNSLQKADITPLKRAMQITETGTFRSRPTKLKLKESKEELSTLPTGSLKSPPPEHIQKLVQKYNFKTSENEEHG